MSEHADHPEPLTILLANHRRFLAFLERRTGNREEAEDLLQDAFVRGVEKASTIRDEESTVAWFFRVLRNALLDRYRRHIAEAKLVAQLPPEQPLEHDPALEREACACIEALLPVLHAEYAEVIRRVDLAGESIGSIAAASGDSPGSARVRLHRARAALRREVERTCRTCAEHGCLDCTCGSKSGREV